MNDGTRIGKNIRDARKGINMTQDQLAKKSNVKQTQLSCFENGKNTPGLFTLAKIAKALNKSIDELFYGDASVSFITTAPDKGAVIANALVALWEQGCIYTEEPPNCEDIDYKEITLKRFDEPIYRLLDALNDLERKKDTYKDPQEFLEIVKQSVAEEIKLLDGNI